MKIQMKNQLMMIKKGKEEKDTRRVNAMYGGSFLVSQWCFLLGTPCSKAYGE
jgi:hypothetical protein